MPLKGGGTIISKNNESWPKIDKICKTIIISKILKVHNQIHSSFFPEKFMLRKSMLRSMIVKFLHSIFFCVMNFKKN